MFTKLRKLMNLRKDLTVLVSRGIYLPWNNETLEDLGVEAYEVVTVSFRLLGGGGDENNRDASR